MKNSPTPAQKAALFRMSKQGGFVRMHPSTAAALVARGWAEWHYMGGGVRLTDRGRREARWWI